MMELLKEVARGKRGARDLTYEESLQAAEAIMAQQATPAQIGAFLIAERVKMESVDELEAFVAVCRKYACRTPIPGGIDCAGPYDGRKTSFAATFATAFLLASAGLPATLHGTASLPPKWGVTLHDILLRIGIDSDAVPREKALQAAKDTGVLYVPAEQWCPPLKRLRSIRVELGMRTIFNTAEKLIGYTHSPYLVFGVYHNTVFDRLARLLLKLDYGKALIVQGPEGSEDLFIDRPTRTYRVENGEFRLQVVDPETFGIDTPLPETDWTADEQLRVTEAVLRGEAHPAYCNQVLLNGAVRLHLADRAKSVEEGLYIGKALLDGGHAWAAYANWRERLSRAETGRVQ